jgi:hypothetical protein
VTDRARRFHLLRHQDISGVSGTGIVADGVIWPDGTASLRWRGERPSTVHWDRIADAKAVHGHGGATEIVLDDAADRLARIAEAHSKNQTSGGMTDGYCDECAHAWPCPTNVWATTDRDTLATWDPADDEEEEQ